VSRWVGLLFGAVLLAGCATGGVLPAARESGETPMPLLEQTPSEGAAKTLKARLDLALAYLERGRVDVALEELDRARAIDADHPLVFYVSGLAQLALGNTEQALAALQAALARAPNDPDLLFSLGSLLCEREERAQGLPLLMRAAANPYFPRRGRAYANAAWCGWQSGHEKDVPGWLDLALTLQSDDFLVRMRLLQWAVRQKRWDEAALHLARLEQIAPDSPTTWWLAANVAHAKGDNRELARWVDRLRREAPDRLETRQAERGEWERW